MAFMQASLVHTFPHELRISQNLKLGENYFFLFFFSIFFVTSKSDFELNEFCMPICNDVQLREPGNLYDL